MLSIYFETFIEHICEQLYVFVTTGCAVKQRRHIYAEFNWEKGEGGRHTWKSATRDGHLKSTLPVDSWENYKIKSATRVYRVSRNHKLLQPFGSKVNVYKMLNGGREKTGLYVTMTAHCAHTHTYAMSLLSRTFYWTG